MDKETTIKIDREGVWINGVYVDTTPDVYIEKMETLRLVTLAIYVDKENLTVEHGKLARNAEIRYIG